MTRTLLLLASAALLSACGVKGSLATPAPVFGGSKATPLPTAAPEPLLEDEDEGPFYGPDFEDDFDGDGSADGL